MQLQHGLPRRCLCLATRWWCRSPRERTRLLLLAVHFAGNHIARQEAQVIWFRRLAFLVLVVVALFSVIGAAAPTSTETAVNIATIVLTLALPFIPLAHLPFSGKQMVAISMVAAFILPVIANFITGHLKMSDLSGGALPLLVQFALVLGATHPASHPLTASVPPLPTN